MNGTRQIKFIYFWIAFQFCSEEKNWWNKRWESHRYKVLKDYSAFSYRRIRVIIRFLKFSEFFLVFWVFFYFRRIGFIFFFRFHIILTFQFYDKQIDGQDADSSCIFFSQRKKCKKNQFIFCCRCLTSKYTFKSFVNLITLNTFLFFP